MAKKSTQVANWNQKASQEKTLKKIYEEEYGIGKELILYRLHVGDQLNISIYGEPNTTRLVTVDPTGSINYLFLDTVFVLDKTIDELRSHLNHIIATHFKHAFIAITPVEFGSQYYTIQGEVKNSGTKRLQGKATLLGAIAQAGGVRKGVYRTNTIELGDLTHAFMARDGEYVPVDFHKLIVEGNMSEDVELQNGDYIYIPNSLHKEINVLGEVNSPTALGSINTPTLTEAIAQAKGLTERASSRAYIIRGNLSNPKKIMIDTQMITQGLKPNFTLQPGDIVYVPSRKYDGLRDSFQDGIRAFVNNYISAPVNSVSSSDEQ